MLALANGRSSSSRRWRVVEVERDSSLGRRAAFLGHAVAQALAVEQRRLWDLCYQPSNLQRSRPA
eukprot:741767-Pyramimonas_sp.AAC.1